ncbi:class I SAM-dependent methyltransferase [Thiobacillus sedimenti]|uniref:SAM-dependent methyltransferase n=1 Tax=Thiobacillus sedimenti TaxID=3110231 RepID=A0ABZ1CIF8_9PROT|nr:SAM-dependent methyltransferase [Thiobacillus sp. SCUT-2]WRS39178.1 SAM-dependent methyltransferase [Thiobacillus sp. SCUT-2]
MLPAPSADAFAHSQRVAAHLRSLIVEAGGWLPFSRFMEAALYAPGLGYYAAGSTKFGAAGDFVTAPEMTPLFGRTLAHAIAPVLAETGGDVLELGAGSGRLAADLLGELERLGALPARYRILEPSPDLRQRQQNTLARDCPQLAARVQWLDALPAHFRGVMLGNEVLDALPVELVHWTDAGPMAHGVTVEGEQFGWQDRAIADPVLRARAEALDLAPGYVSEINLAADALIASLADALERGLILLIDYGFVAAEYYHPQRHMGTLRAHYRHHALDDPFHLPGLCDLTAHVDFSAVAHAGMAAGLTLAGYTSQASFLLNGGLTELLMQTPPEDAAAYLPQANAAQRLVSPAEMGELFKVIGLTKGDVAPLAAFARGDRQYTL